MSVSLSPLAPAVLILGPFPPPITGAAKNTQNMLDALKLSGASVTAVSSSVALKRESSGIDYHIQRIRRIFGVLREMFAARDSKATLYNVPDAGWGAWYTLIYMLFALVTFGTIVFHHRSYLYVSQHSYGMQLIVAVTRRRAIHVFLTESMDEGFRRRYGPVQSMISGNACFVQRNAALAVASTRSESGTITIGHLSNLRRNKGFFAAADVFERLANEGMPVRLHLAGPITEKEVQPRLDELASKFGDRIRWYGQIYGDAKTDFYRELDVFLFATTHPQEAQPNVIYEALAAGVPVLATPRACIPEMLGGPNGACSPDESNFVDFAADAIRAMSFDDVTANVRRSAIASLLETESQKSQDQYRHLLEKMGVAAAAVRLPWS
jgi:glycosyltransferase involved in cell wall biosynthesis